jgi:hypothetical protein
MLRVRIIVSYEKEGGKYNEIDPFGAHKRVNKKPSLLK